MNYELEFHPKALREWNKLGDTIKKQFKTKLTQRLDTPRIATAKRPSNLAPFNPVATPTPCQLMTLMTLIFKKTYYQTNHGYKLYQTHHLNHLECRRDSVTTMSASKYSSTIYLQNDCTTNQSV